MAESIIQVAPDSTGKKVHTFNRTIGANSVEDEVNLLGENYLASYTIPSNGFVSAATANSHLLQVMAGASLKVRVRKIEIYQSAMATAAAIMQVQILRLTTAGTGGTATGTAVLDPADAASGATSITLPGVKGAENAQPIWQGTAYLMQTIGASAPQVDPILTIDFDRLRSKPFIIAAGITNGFCVKNLTAHAAATLAIMVYIDESNF